MLYSSKRRSGNHSGRSLRVRPIRRLRVEQLEDRSLPAVQLLATLGDPAPGPGASGYMIFDFEPYSLTNRGEALYSTDLSAPGDPTTPVGEALFLRDKHGQVKRLAGSTDPAPGGGTYDLGTLQGALNERGDAAFTFVLSPFTLPFGANSGTYRYSSNTRTVTPVVLPYVTPAPGGGTFQGTAFYPDINNRGDLLFDGLVVTNQGIHVPGEPYVGLGQGIFQADRFGHISSVVSPGDAAPGGGTFDFAGLPRNNDRGTIVFTGHVAGDPASIPGNPPQAVIITALANGYVRNAATGHITEFAHVGNPIPAAAGGGVYGQIMFPSINNSGDVCFKVDLTPAPAAGQVIGLFRYSHGAVRSVARPGDAMPGGGHLVTVSSLGGHQEHINDRGDIVFNGTLDTDVDGDGLPDQGTYQWSRGHLSVVARTGTVLPGIGTVRSFVPPVGISIPPPTSFVPNSGSINNDRGQVLFSALLTDGRYVLLLSTPHGCLPGGPYGPAAAAAPALPAASSQDALPQDPVVLVVGTPDVALGTSALRRSAAPSERSVKVPPFLLPTVVDQPATLERATARATSHASQDESDRSIEVWDNVLGTEFLIGNGASGDWSSPSVGLAVSPCG